jgi:polysaccharide pyruvyl transferase WcaK-like protein
MSAPVLGLAYAPKVRHFMKMLGTEDRIFELDRTTGEGLSEAIISSWEGREENLHKVRPVMEEVKERARAAYRDAYERYLTETV